MKNNRSVTKGDLIDGWIAVSNFREAVPKSKLSSGSIVNKHPVILDGGKTIVFIADVTREPEVRHKYEVQKSRKAFSR